jgi:hypothetical protein
MARRPPPAPRAAVTSVVHSDRRNPLRGAGAFELQLPWNVLGGRPEAELPFAIELHGPDGAALRLPAGTEADTGVLVVAP